MKRLGLVGVTVIAVAVIAIAACGLALSGVATGGRTRHAEGDGPLGGTPPMSYVTPSGGPGTSWAFGLPACTRTGEAVEIETVRAIGLTGEGATFLDPLAYRLTRSHSTFDYAAPRFPPQGVEGAVPAAGYVIDHGCDDTRTMGQEVFAGIRLSERGSGGWSGIEIDYQASGKPYTLVLDVNLSMCGPDMTDPACAGIESPSPTVPEG
jgi:hypothetical protein